MFWFFLHLSFLNASCSFHPNPWSSSSSSRLSVMGRQPDRQTGRWKWHQRHQWDSAKQCRRKSMETMTAGSGETRGKDWGRKRAGRKVGRRGNWGRESCGFVNLQPERERCRLQISKTDLQYEPNIDQSPRLRLCVSFQPSILICPCCFGCFLWSFVVAVGGQALWASLLLRFQFSLRRPPAVCVAHDKMGQILAFIMKRDWRCSYFVGVDQQSPTDESSVFAFFFLVVEEDFLLQGKENLVVLQLVSRIMPGLKQSTAAPFHTYCTLGKIRICLFCFCRVKTGHVYSHIRKTQTEDSRPVTSDHEPFRLNTMEMNLLHPAAGLSNCRHFTSTASFLWHYWPQRKSLISFNFRLSMWSILHGECSIFLSS